MLCVVTSTYATVLEIRGKKPKLRENGEASRRIVAMEAVQSILRTPYLSPNFSLVLTMAH